MRRAFRRQMRKGFEPRVPPILQEANLAFDKGEYGRAAELFEQIASNADARGGSRAAVFHLQAGRARILAGQSSLGMPSLKRGLDLLAQSGRHLRLHRARRQLISELHERGLTKEAAEIESWHKTDSSPLPTPDETEARTKRPILPTHCPSCGAALKSDEVEWLDDVTAECEYCGSPVRQAK